MPVKDSRIVSTAIPRPELPIPVTNREIKYCIIFTDREHDIIDNISNINESQTSGLRPYLSE